MTSNAEKSRIRIWRHYEKGLVDQLFQFCCISTRLFNHSPFTCKITDSIPRSVLSMLLAKYQHFAESRWFSPGILWFPPKEKVDRVG